MVECSGVETLVNYDYLVLCTGVQVYLPEGLDSTKHVFTLRDEQEVASVMSWVENELIPGTGTFSDHFWNCINDHQFLTDCTGNLVVYGSLLEAYAAVQSVLRCGLPLARLFFVQPDPQLAFNNPTVEERVGVALEGVSIYAGYSLEGWVVEEEGLRAVQLRANGEGAKQVTLDCEVCTLYAVLGKSGVVF